jgi:tetratricopeptide (TPR) repeat protein
MKFSAKPRIYLYLLSSCLVCFANSRGLAQPDLIDKADSLKRAGNYTEALNIFQEILDEDIKTSDTKKQAKDYNNLANVYSDVGDYEKSTTYYFKAIQIAEQLGEKELLLAMYYNISNSYYFAGKLNYSIEFLNKAIELIRNGKGNQPILGACYNMLGGILAEEKNYDEGLVYLRKAEQIFTSIKDTNSLGNMYVSMANVGLEKLDLKLAEESSLKSLDIFRQTNDQIGVATSYINLQVTHAKLADQSNTLNKKKELHTAILFLDSAESAIRDINNPEINIKILENKHETYSNLEQYDSAYFYQKKYFSLNDSIHAIKKNKQLDELKVKYDSEKKDKEILLLKNASQKERDLVIILSIVLFAILLFAVLLFRINRIRARHKAQQLEQRLLRLQMTPHFLFNAINSIQNFILKKNQQEAYDFLAKFAKLIRIVLDNSQEKTLVLHQEMEMIALYVELEQMRFNNQFDFTLSIDKSINDFEIAVPPMLIQPYIENAIWHGLMNLRKEQKGILSVDIARENGALKIVIEDNGIGRVKAKEYRKEETHHSFAMKLTEQRLQMLNLAGRNAKAEVSVTDLYDAADVACGTRVQIYLPIHGK